MLLYTKYSICASVFIHNFAKKFLTIQNFSAFKGLYIKLVTILPVKEGKEAAFCRIFTRHYRNKLLLNIQEQTAKD